MIEQADDNLVWEKAPPDGAAGDGRWRSFQPDAETLVAAGYSSVAGCWAIFQPDGSPARIQNEYLRERFTADWIPRLPDREAPLSANEWSPSTSKGAADRLSNCLNWMMAAGYDWRTIDYGELLHYQNDMVRGLWVKSRLSRVGVGNRNNSHPLSHNVANARADDATFFLLWAAEKGYRSNFHVPSRLGKVKRKGGKERLTWVRLHRLKSNPSTFVIKHVPTFAQVKIWEDAVQKDKGWAKRLNCSFLVRTAVRLEEGTSMTVGQWPSAEELAVREAQGYASVPILLTVTKGRKPRYVDVPLDLAEEIRDYIDTVRLTAQLRFRKRTGKQSSDLLFLSDSRGSEGIPLSRRSIYLCFKKRVPGGPRDWYPHMARHFYACQHILDAVRTDAALLRQDVTSLGVDWVAAKAGYHLELLRQQLGHQDASTTKIYLKWLLTALGLVGVTSSWMRKLDAGGENDAV